MSTTEKVVVFGGLAAAIAFVFWKKPTVDGHTLPYMQQELPGYAYAQGLNLREVNSPETEPPGGGPVYRPYIDESPWNPNEHGGQAVIPNRYGVQHQQSSGLL